MARRTRGSVTEPDDTQWAEWSGEDGAEPIDSWIAEGEVVPTGRYDENFIPPLRRGRGFLVFLAVLAIIAALALLAVRWVQRQLDPPGPAREKIEMVIPEGASSARIATLLEQNKLVGSGTLFRYYAQVKGRGNFEAGKYAIRENDTFEHVLNVLTEGPLAPAVTKLTIPEGFRLEQVAERVEAQLDGHTKEGFLAEAAKGTVKSDYLPAGSTNLEGVLFPDTYNIALDDTDGAILARMVDAFDQAAIDAQIPNAQELVGVSPYEAVIIASMVEREAKLDEDRPKIARVIYNRLKAKQLLQIDAAVIYARNTDLERVTAADLEVDSPYNTYKRKGLPPTPIAMPGKASLEAALRPAEGDWLYYVVTTAEGGHSFANTFKEHRANIKIAKQNGLR